MNLLRDGSTLLTSCFSLVLFLILFKPRFSLKKTLLLTVATMVPLMVLNSVLFFLIGAEKMGKLMLLSCSLPSLIFFWFISQYRDGRFFFTFCFADTLIMEVIYITRIIDHYLGNQCIFLVLSRLVICPLLALYMYKGMRPILHSLQKQVRRGWYAFSAISLIFYVLLSMSVSVPGSITERPEYFPGFILLLLLMPLLYMNIFTTLRHQQQLHEMTQQDNILKLQVANMTARMEEYNASDEKHRMERHDFRHKMLTVRTLLEQQQYDELQKLVSGYAESAQETPVCRYCSSPVIDAVLSSYLLRAEKHDIQIITGLSFPSQLPISETELATVFANALENALNACNKVPQEDRFIKIQVLSTPRLMIQISNSYNGKVIFDEHGIPQSRHEGHGFATRSIVAFCKKNDALYEFKATKNVFALRLVFS